jgi:hypothetical protein
MEGEMVSLALTEKRGGKLARPQSLGMGFFCGFAQLVEMTGFEPVASCLQSRRSPN